VVEKSPDAFRTISEAAQELDLPQHVLRFWETRFSTIKPLKRGGGRRYYRPEDVLLLKGIRHLLYDQGFTIKGVQKILKDHGVRNVIAIGDGRPMEPVTAAELAAEARVDEPQADAEIDADAIAETMVEGRAPKPPAPMLDQQGKDRLNKVMKDLLDCKRLLDRAREA
jgi:DNA-binding transcriptional MerR regulator